MWTKIGDEFIDDAADLSDAAVRTHLEALAWSNRRLLDLVVPKRDLRRFAFSEAAHEAAAELVAVGWWEDRGDRWFLAYRHEWQQSREQVETRRQTNLRAQWHRRGRHDLCDPDKCSALSSADTSADTADDPGRDGSGRENAPTEEPQATANNVRTCRECGHYEPLNDEGTCRDVMTCRRTRGVA